MKIKLNVKEIFDYNNDFELIMFQVFTARNDTYTVNLLLDKSENLSERFFLFKMMLGVLREAEELIREINDKYKNELCKFDNWLEIENKIAEYKQLNNGVGDESFSYKVLSKIRHQIFHYKKIKELKKYFPNILETDLSIELGDIRAEEKYDFVNSVLCEYISEKLEGFSGDRDIGEFISKIAPYSMCIAKLLDELIEGYFGKYTNLMENDFDGENLKRKR